MSNNFSENYMQFGYAPSKIFASPVLSRESSKNIGFKERLVVNLPGTFTRLGPTD